jgi:hypothetical protein
MMVELHGMTHFNSSLYAMKRLFRDRWQFSARHASNIEIGQLAALVARFSERASSIGEVPRTKLSIIAAKASGSSCVVR